jgi:two-component system, sensor histidine kinase LadS
LKRKIWLIIVCFTLWAEPVNASNAPLILDDGRKVYNPAENAFFFADDDNSITIDDILKNRQEEKFIAITNKVPSFGLNNTPVWIRFDITSRFPEDFFLLIENPSLSSVDFYLVDTSGVIIKQVATGSYKSMDAREVRTANFYFGLHLQDSRVYTCYLKIRTTVSSMSVPMQVATMKHFYEQKHSLTLWQGLYFGLFVFMFIYNAFLFYSLRDTSYLYFASFIFFMGLMFAAGRGFGLEYLWSSNPFLNEFVPVYGSLAGIFVILFTARFLHSEKNTPKLHLWLIAIISLFVVNIIVFLVGWRFLAYQIILYNATVTLFFIMFVALKVWLDGYGPAKYYLFAWSFFVAGIIVFFLRELGLLPINTFNGNILQIASTVTILFMSFALSRKINIYIESRNQAQEMALQTALENERLISDQNQLLEARVTQRTIDLKETVETLQKQRADLDEANTFKDKIFSIISHDLKSPVATLAGLLQVLKLKTLSEAEKNKIVVNLEIALKATKILLDNMLAWSVKSDRKTMENEELSLRDVVAEVLSLFEFQAESKNINLRNLVEGNYYFYANKNMIQLVLRNLISNSIKFTPKYGLIEVGMQQDVPNLSLYIKDTGIGMSKEFIQNLFKSNVHTSTRGTDNEKGTGLGLKLCKEFIEKMNGSISVESQPGQGTTFTILLQNAVPELEVITV